ncbi:MAG: class I SAM-dependent methyltransferase [Bacteroidetes bacterium]|nr:class I SAM-dependent methyltransferase [Bacteroidota bacterium]
MKVRESGMPDEPVWSSFFEPEMVLKAMLVDEHIDDLCEIGCGYGTFTLPAARIIGGELFGFDIEAAMVAVVNQKLLAGRISNVRLAVRDVLKLTTGLESASIDYVMLFNLLHHDKPEELFGEAFRVLKQHGRLGILHWRSDIATPRGPDLSIRPSPERILQLFDNNQFAVEKPTFFIGKYHYGMVLQKQ